MTARNLGGLQLAWQALLPASALWVAALAVCVISLQLLSGTGQRQTDDRGAKAEAAASEILAADLLHPGSPEFPSTVRALLQRADIGFAYLRVYNAEGVAVASVGRLSQSWPRGIRVSVYQLISTPHKGPLLYKGRQIGSLEYGLFPGGGSGHRSAWSSWIGAIGLLLGLPWLLLMSLRLKSELQGLWTPSPPAVVRRLSAEIVPPMAASRDQVAPEPVVQEKAGQLMAVFDHGVVMVDRQQCISYVNALAERLLGRAAAEVQGRPVAEVLQLFGPDLRHQAVLPIASCLAGEVDRVQEQLYLRRTVGAALKLEISIAPVLDRVGAITGVLIALHPPARRSSMPQLARAQNEVTQTDSGALSMMLLDQVLESVVTTDSQDRIQFANSRALETFGYTLPVLRGAHISKLLPVPFLKQAQLRIADYMQGESSELPEVIARRQDGTQFPAMLVVHPVAFRDRQGHVITVRKAARQQRSTLSQRLRHLLDNATEEMLVFDADTLRVLDANNHARNNLGYGIEQLSGMTPLQLSPRLSHEQFEAYVTRLRIGAEDQVVYQALMQRANASTYEAEVRLHFYGDETPPVYLATVQDLGRVAQVAGRSFDEDRLNFLAYHDALTGLPSRLLFLDRLRKQVAQATHEKKSFAVAYTGLSGFRAVNDRYGYETGDLLLKAVADRLSSTVASADTVARLGGDEFTIILSGLTRQDIASAIKSIQDAFARPLRAGSVDIAVDMSIGVTFFPSDNAAAEQLLLHADAAMRKAREKGRREWQLFEARVPSKAPAAPTAETAGNVLRRLVTEGKLSVDFQPLVDTRTMQTIAAEVFMHWQHPDHGVLRTTGQVREVSKTRGLAEEIVQWVMECACQQYSAWRDMELPTLPILINMSALSLDRERLLQQLRDLLGQYRLPEEDLVICYSEAELLHAQEKGGEWLRSLRNLGVRLCIDDVDSASADTLRRLDADLVRLTPRATAGLPASPEALALARGIIERARQVGARIVASQIERTEQMSALSELGCHIFQGRLVGEVMSTREFARQLVRMEVGVL